MDDKRATIHPKIWLKNNFHISFRYLLKLHWRLEITKSPWWSGGGTRTLSKKSTKTHIVNAPPPNYS